MCPQRWWVVMGRVVPLADLAQVIAAERAAGKRIVLTNGCFDLLHVGHVRGFQASRAHGDVLVVGANADESVRRLKGPDRPLVPEHERAEILAALAAVDYVAIFPETTAETLAALVRPDVYVKGADYASAPDSSEPRIDEQRLPEARIVRAHGGRVVLLPITPGRSTTGLVERIRASTARRTPPPAK
jgi:D-beta-D-heptose 7-phosphate kinase/D-beta-D-heptose 1-phosphate adenosyltransferase